MKVIRRVMMKVEQLEVGDQMTVKVKGYGIYTATVHKVTDNRALVIFDNCIVDKPMNENGRNDGGFTASNLYGWLNGVFINMLPTKIRSRLTEDDEHDRITVRVPTRGEMLGHNSTSKNYEPDSDEQLTLMKDRKNRVCASMSDECAFYWLMNAKGDTSRHFASINGNGNSTAANASDSFGVRPAFMLRNF